MEYSEPFPHAQIDNYLTKQQVQRINEEWPTRWHKERGRFSVKWSHEYLSPTAREVFDAIDMAEIERITGIQGLFKDPKNRGGGHHCIPRGGFLDMHCDFNVHSEGWLRRVNMLIYLNEGWEPEWMGQLCLGLPIAKRIDPIAGRAVIFETNEESWHGHPEPLKCPKDRERRSLAFYFYSEGTADPHSTIYIK